MKLTLPKIFTNKSKKNINFITIDGITCSGKSKLTKLLVKSLKNNNNNIQILSKDLFLKTREKRIQITKKIKKNYSNQNELHYDLKKLKTLINFFLKPGRKKTLKLFNLYNRKNGKNDSSINFKFRKKNLIIFEGIYVNDDLKGIVQPKIKVLVIESIHNSLSRKIKRIRDKKISIQNVVKEFTKIHLFSYKKYLLKHKYDLNFKFEISKFTRLKNGKERQISLIKKFLSKHSF